MNQAQHINELISNESLTDTLLELVDIASPTGEEHLLASHITRQMESFGISSQTQVIANKQSNSVGVLKGRNRNSRSLMLYAPIDTVTSNAAEEDVPWAAETFRKNMRANAFVEDGHIIGLGAHNPKGHAACILETARILKKLNLNLDGDIHFGFGAGGMPTHGRAGFDHDTGHGRGCKHMLGLLPKMSGAIIAKSGTSVTWEEVGFIWLEVTVAGKHNYVGARHLMPYDNAIANASKLILKLEDWFEIYAEENATDIVKPQGTVSYIEAGWKRMPAFTPAAAKFLVDLRFGPNMSADDCEAKFSIALERFSNELDLKASYKRVQTIEASHTPPSDPIIQTTVKVWEKLQGRPHEPFKVMSGATDANILRGHGIPTARIGLAKSKFPDMDFGLGMNSVAISELRHLTKLLTLSAIQYSSGAAHG